MPSTLASILLVGLVTFSLLSSTLYSREASVYQSAYAKPNKPDLKNTLTVNVDKHQYEPGENVTIAGSVTTNLRPELDDNTNLISLQVKDNKDGIVASGEAEIGNAGEYSKIFKLPQDARYGAYIVDATVQLATDPSDNLTDNGTETLHKTVKFVVVGHSGYSKVKDEALGKYIASNSTTNNSTTADTSRSTITDSNNSSVPDLFYSKEKNIKESDVETLHKSVKFASSKYPVRLDGNEFTIYIVSNSTVTDFIYSKEQNMVSFKVEGESGTRGVAQITLPKDLLGEEIIVSIDGRDIAEDSPDVVITYSEDEISVEITYLHSEHSIRLRGKNIVPQPPDSLLQPAGRVPQPDSFPVTTAVSIFVIVIIAAVAIFLSIYSLFHQKQMEKGGQGTWRRLRFPSSTRGEDKVIDFYCMSCGKGHDLSACPSRGSKIKKPRF